MWLLQGNIGKAEGWPLQSIFPGSQRCGDSSADPCERYGYRGDFPVRKSSDRVKLDIRDYLDLLAVWFRMCCILRQPVMPTASYLKNVRAITEQTRHCSYEGLEQILEGIQKAKARLTANVNFDLTMELLFLLIKENQ